MFVFKSLVLTSWLACMSCQYTSGPTTTPVPILKQINKQNDDGSYSYGYEAADGSFKIETKYTNGDVAGKYGYVDADGKVREISYGASSKRGFEPQGTGIQVPPPTLHETPSNALTDGQEDDGQYREDPKIYEDPKYNSHGAKASRQFLKPVNTRYQQDDANQYQIETKPQPQYQQYSSPTSQFRSAPSAPLFTQQTSLFNQPQYSQPQTLTQPQYSQPQTLTQPQYSQPQTLNQPQYSQPQTFNQPQSLFQSSQPFAQEYKPQSQVYHQTPQFSYQSLTAQAPQYNQYQSQYQPQNPFPNFNPFSGHPAQNFDPNTGSYTINFTGK